MSTPLPPFTRNDLKNSNAFSYLGKVRKGYLLDIHGADYIVTPEELALLDARLPEVARILTRGLFDADPDDAAKLCAASLRYWDNPSPVWMYEMQDETSTEDQYVLDTIYSIHPPAAGVNTFYIDYTQSETATFGALTFVKDLRGCATSVNYGWCEHHFPGSTSRLKACFAMDMRSSEIAQVCFYPDVMSAPTVLPELILPGLE